MRNTDFSVKKSIEKSIKKIINNRSNGIFLHMSYILFYRINERVFFTYGCEIMFNLSFSFSICLSLYEAKRSLRKMKVIRVKFCEIIQFRHI